MQVVSTRENKQRRQHLPVMAQQYPPTPFGSGDVARRLGGEDLVVVQTRVQGRGDPTADGSACDEKHTRVK